MRHATITLALLLVPFMAWGTTWYFDDCASGGDGSIGDPFCLDPDTDGDNDSVMYLFDGADTEAASGDIIYLRAGTYYVDCTGLITGENHSVTYWLQPDMGNVTIAGYTGETAIITGDRGGDATYTDPLPACAVNDDIDTLITNAGLSTDVENVTFRNLTLQYTGDIGIFLTNVSHGANGWLFDDITEQYVGTEMWGGDDFYTSGCTAGSQHFGMKVRNITGNFTVQNSTFAHICGIVHRNVNNDGGGGVFLFDTNEYYDTGDVNNDFLGLDSTGVNYATFTWRNIYAHDVRQGMSVEDRMRSVTIEDSRFYCLGEYQTHEYGYCAAAIKITNGDSPTTQGGTTHNITIRRNKVYSKASTPAFGAATCPWAALSDNCGWWLEGISWVATCDSTRDDGCTVSGGLIENNMVWNHNTASSGNCEQGGICVWTNNNGVTVQNNTVYGGAERGIVLDNGICSTMAYLDCRTHTDCHVGTCSVTTATACGEDADCPETETCVGGGGTCSNPARAWTIKNNLVYSTADVAIWGNTDVATTGITYNNLKPDGDPAVTVSAASTNCADIAGFGTSNKCADSVLINVAGAVGTWDLHLDPTDTNNKNAGTAGATDDIDVQSRPKGLGTEIGADELPETSATHRVLVISLLMGAYPADVLPPNLEIPLGKVALIEERMVCP